MRTLALLVIVALIAGLAYLALHRHDRPAAARPSVPAPPPPEPPTPLVPAPPPPEPPPPPKPPAPPPPAPRLQPGKTVTVILSEPPAERYEMTAGGDSDSHYRDLVSEVAGGRAEYDANLGRAARELVYQTTEFGEVVPGDVREFAIASAGAVAADSVYQQIRTNEEGDAAIKKAIAQVLTQKDNPDGPLRLGVGEVYRQGLPLPRHIGVVGTRVGVRIEPLAVRVQAGVAWPIRGQLLANWRNIKALVLQGDGKALEQEVSVDGDRIGLDVVARAIAGPLDVQLVGEGPSGPGKIVQLRGMVGRDPPDRITAQIPADESKLTTAAAAEGYALQLLNADRQKHGLPALGWDPQLAEIARSHSQDMKDHSFFGHQSPRTGLPQDRLRAAGYLARAHAENVAFNGTLFEAEEGLMHSLGHRRNILSTDVDRVGIGVVLQVQDKGRRYWLTQLFAKPALDWTPEQVEAQLVQRVQAARQAAGLGPLAIDGPLTGAARQAAEAAGEDFSGVAHDALQRAKDGSLFSGKLHASAALTGEPDSMELPAETLAAEAKTLAIGAARRSGHAQFAVVFLVVD